MNTISKIKKVDYSILFLWLAILLHTVVYFRNRSFFLDECNLARNIVERSCSDLIGNLDYGQHAPPFLSFVTKFFIQTLGIHEYSFRLLPFLAGIGSIFLFHQLLRLWLTGQKWLHSFSIALFGFSYYLLEYSTSFKQYALDVFFTCLFLLLSQKITLNNWKNGLLLGLLGMVGLWFSMPLAFVLAGVGLFYISKHYSIEKRLFSIPQKNTYLAILLWLISFGILFWVNLKPSIASSHLQNYHAPYFLQLPTSIASIEQNLSILLGLFRNIVGKTTLPLLFAIFGFSIGIYQLYKKQSAHLVLLLFPILSCFFASLLQMYSLLTRLVLFLSPIFILIISIGLAKTMVYITAISNKKIQLFSSSIVAFLMLLSLVGQSGIQYVYQPLPKNNPRRVLQQLSTTKMTNIPIYVTHFGVPSQTYYTQMHQPSISFPFSPIISGHWSDNLIQLSEEWKQKGWQQVWIYDSHTYGKELQQLQHQVGTIGAIKEKYEDRFAHAVLVELR